MARDGDGSRVLVDLPYGKGLDDAVKARGAIASGLDVALSQVFIHRDPTSHRRHVLWVADRDPLAVPVGRTPLLACQPTDIWKPAPFGLDERGVLVSVPLMWNSLLVSALPRAGKTFAARALALYAALDPYARLDVFDPADAGLHWTEAAERLARRFPDRWTGTAADAVSAQCRALGVASVDVKRAGRTAKGCRRDAIEAARQSR